MRRHLAELSALSVVRVIFLPGIVLPAQLAYGGLVAALGPDVEAVAKDLEVYSTPEPREDYSLELEIAGVLREADERAWDRFHLVGYSGGGAAALAFAAIRPARLASLALLEPAWAGTWDLSPAEQAVWLELDRLAKLPDDQLMPGFMRFGLRPGVPVPPPPPGEPPPWMATRPAGIRAIQRAFRQGAVEREGLSAFDRPVYLALGALSNPDHYAEIARRLSGAFPDFQLEVFEERHHFDPPHRTEPERLARSLESLWRRAEAQPG
jgi:pimeloyl-ACP methyl ester carboxylesterase